MDSQKPKPREALLIAAESLLVEGDLRLTVRSIATRGGIALGALYTHFPDREALLAALIERGFEGIHGAARRLESRVGEGSVVGNLEEFAEMALGGLAPHLAKLVVREPDAAKRVDPDTQFAPVINGLEAYVTGEQRVGRVDSALSAKSAATLMVAVLHMAFFQSNPPAEVAQSMAVVLE